MTTLSVIVPAYNEERSLACCIQRVLAITDEQLDLEILIVDDASTDRTGQIADNLALAATLIASSVDLIFNFAGRRIVVFAERHPARARAGGLAVAPSPASVSSDAMPAGAKPPRTVN